MILRNARECLTLYSRLMLSIEQANSRTCAAGVISQSISYASGISTKRPQRVRPVPFVMDPSMTDSALAARAEVDALTPRTPVSRVEDPTYVPYDRQRAVVIAHHPSGSSSSWAGVSFHHRYVDDIVLSFGQWARRW